MKKREIKRKNRIENKKFLSALINDFKKEIQKINYPANIEKENKIIEGIRQKYDTAWNKFCDNCVKEKNLILPLPSWFNNRIGHKSKKNSFFKNFLIYILNQLKFW